MIDVGDQQILTYPSKPASPATVTVTIGLPDGTTAGPFSAISGSYTYTTTQPGRHTVLWVATGPSDAYSDTFDVAASDGGAIISLADAKAHLRMSSASTNDEELRLFITAATALVEHEVGPVVQGSHTEIVDAAETIVLDKAPVLSITSITPTFPLPDFTVGVPTYSLEPSTGILRQQPFWFSSWGFDGIPNYATAYGLRLTIEYVAGRPVIPAPLQIAARIIVESLWESRRLAGPKPAAGEEPIPYGREVIPPHAVELIAPYRRAPQVV